MRLPEQFITGLNAAHFDVATYQRNDVLVDPVTGVKLGKKKDESVNSEVTTLDDEYLESVDVPGHMPCTSHPLLGLYSPPPSRHWRGDELDLLDDAMTLPYSEVSEVGSSANEKALEALYTLGIVIVTGTPTTEAEIYGLSNAFTGPADQGGEPEPNVYSSTTGPLKTLYGSTWATTVGSDVQGSGASTADSAYSQDSLPLHTDNTYFKTPPGLQIFNMATPAADGSGRSTYLDGFGAAEELRRTCPDSFACLSSTKFRYRSVDATTGWHLEASGTIITVDDTAQGAPVTGIRHNDLDRMGCLPPYELRGDEGALKAFYERVDSALAKWDSIINEPGRRAVVALKQGGEEKRKVACAMSKPTTRLPLTPTFIFARCRLRRCPQQEGDARQGEFHADQGRPGEEHCGMLHGDRRVGEQVEGAVHSIMYKIKTRIENENLLIDLIFCGWVG